MKKIITKAMTLIVALLMSTTQSKAADQLYAVKEGNTVTLKFGEISQSEINAGGRAYSGGYKYSWMVYFSDATSVVVDSSCKNYNGTTLSYLFCDCKKVEIITGLNNLNTSNVTNMEKMFMGCYSLTSVDVSAFNTSNVKNMDRMFFSCKGLTSIDLSSFNTENVTNMYEMFSYCKGLTFIDFSSFNTENVTTMQEMFYDCTGLLSLDLSSFNTKKVTIMQRMFEGCSSITSLDLSTFNTANVTDMYNMFRDCTNLKTIYISDNWDVSNVTKSDYMFKGCTSLEGDDGTKVGSNTSKDCAYAGPGGYMSKKVLFAVVDGSNVILKCGAAESGSYIYTGEDSWNTDFATNITTITIDESCKNNTGDNLSFVFADCDKLENIIGLGNLNTSKVTNFSSMFYQCEKLTTLDLSGWKTANVTNMSNMFRNCESLKTIYVDDNWNTASVNASSNMFRDCISIKGEDGTTYDSSKRDVAYAHTGTGGYLTKATTEVRNVSSSTIRNNVSLKKIIKDGIILIGDHNVAGERIK